MLNGCPREKEVKELVERGQWPAATSPELAAHLRECRSCADLALVTDALQHARAEAAGPRNVGAPGLLWWRAQLRRREAAVERIGKPILGAQIFALAVNLVVVVGFVAWQAMQGVDWLEWLEAHGLGGPGLWTMVASALSGWGLMALLSAVATVTVLAGVVVFLAAERQ
ncbi:MAG TPA: hypothetical protein VF730_01810 [Terracidiphilus sp.]